MDHVRRVVIGVGSNLGDRAENIAQAIARLRADPELRVLRTSPIYESAPAGGPSQGDYLNAAVLVVTSLPAHGVLERALGIERAMGRTRPDPVRWGPRTLDLDILWIEGEAVHEAGLEVPHPRLRERPFAVRPLVDIAPDATDPDTGERYAHLPAASEPISKLPA